MSRISSLSQTQPGDFRADHAQDNDDIQQGGDVAGHAHADGACAEGQPHTHRGQRLGGERLRTDVAEQLDVLDQLSRNRPEARDERRASSLAEGLRQGAAAQGAIPGARQSGSDAVDVTARFDAAEAQADEPSTREAAIAAFLQLGNDETLTPATRARAFVAAGRVAWEVDSSNTRAELFYLRAQGLDARLDETVPGARVLHLRILAGQGRQDDMLPLLSAELHSLMPVTDDNRDQVTALLRTQATVLEATTRFNEALEVLDAALQIRADGGDTSTDPVVMGLRLRRANVLQAEGARLQELDVTRVGPNDRQGRRLVAQSRDALRELWANFQAHGADFPEEHRQQFEYTLRLRLAERIIPRFNRRGQRIPGNGVTRADLQQIDQRFRAAEALYNQAVSRPPEEREQALEELAQVRQHADAILELDENDGLAHSMWTRALEAEFDIDRPLIGPLNSVEQRQAVLGQLMELAGQARVGRPPREGQPEVAIVQLFPEWEQLGETQRAIVAYQILGFGELIPSVIESGAQYRFMGVGTSGAEIDPGTEPTLRNAEDRAYYTIRGWAYDTGSGHFIVTGVEDILSSGRGAYATISHEFAHLVHQVMEDARAARARGRALSPQQQVLAEAAERIDAEFQAVRADRPRVVYYDVAAALTAGREVSAVARQIHEEFLQRYRANNGGASPPADPSPPLRRFFDSYAGRNPQEYFAQSVMQLMTGGSDHGSRQLFSRNPTMWQFSRALVEQFRSFPPGHEHGLDFQPVGLDAAGSPTTLGRLRRQANNPHVGRNARTTLEHMFHVADPPPAPGVPALQRLTTVVGNPSAVEHPLARRLIEQSESGEFVEALETARALQSAAHDGALSAEGYTDAATALTSAMAAAEQAAQWGAWQILLAVLLALFTGGIGAAVYAGLREREAKALRDAMTTEPLARQDEGAFRAVGLAVAQEPALANLRAVAGEAGLRQTLGERLAELGFEGAQQQQRIDWLLDGIAEADRTGLAAAPNPYAELGAFSAEERETRMNLLLRRAGELAEVDVGAHPLNYLGDQVVETGDPAVREWSYVNSDALIDAMGFAELEAHVQLELAALQAQLAAPDIAPDRRQELQQARQELHVLNRELRAHWESLFGSPSANPPEAYGDLLAESRERLRALHRTVLGPTPTTAP